MAKNRTCLARSAHEVSMVAFPTTKDIAMRWTQFVSPPLAKKDPGEGRGVPLLEFVRVAQATGDTW